LGKRGEVEGEEGDVLLGEFGVDFFAEELGSLRPVMITIYLGCFWAMLRAA